MHVVLSQAWLCVHWLWGASLCCRHAYKLQRPRRNKQFGHKVLLLNYITNCNKAKGMHTVSVNWFLYGLEWILNLEFCLLKLLIFYQKLIWNIRSRLNSSTFWVFEPVFTYVWSKLKLFEQKMKIFIKQIKIQDQKLKM